MSDEIKALEAEIVEKITRLNELRKAEVGEVVKDYAFTTGEGTTSLGALFGDNDNLLVIHNMGQGCRYCTLWADGFNGLLPHLESALSVVLVSAEAPSVQREFANSRGWRFRLASHGGDAYAKEQIALSGYDNMPGAALYVRNGDEIRRKSTCVFGPNDIYCSLWPLLGLAGLDETDWVPQFRYWHPPEKLLDGGERRTD